MAKKKKSKKDKDKKDKKKGKGKAKKAKSPKGHFCFNCGHVVADVAVATDLSSVHCIQCGRVLVDGKCKNEDCSRYDEPVRVG